ncbi:hypothetical protein DM860_005497 [Cuscuta australis]|uniref:Stress-response A/B barrel domain-containing protein n=1 Tax=Cuscuta australis TaxID=267555 RepID=A0A328E3Z0_9ASTE|nr:hypothetical protein DM860_005497 [Cuscuta australis]
MISVKPLCSPSLSTGASTATTRRRVSPASSVKVSAKQIVEHVVLVRTKPGVEHSKINDMLRNLYGLASLPQVRHLTTGPILRTQSPAPAFTHLFHSRYDSASDLEEYNAHHLHLSVVRNYLFPIIDDIVVADWISDDFSGSTEVAPGSIIRAKLLKLKENLTENKKNQIVDVTKGLKRNFAQIEQLTVGGNIAEARTKGFSIASIGVFGGLDAVQALDAQSAALSDQKDGVRGFVDDVLVVDYPVPAKAGC